MRKTKILCTVGPATESVETLQSLIEAGANIFRLNMSHAKHDWCAEVVQRIRQAAEQAQSDVAVLVDLQGPSIRTGPVDGSFDLKEGDAVEFTMGGAVAKIPFSTSVNYDGLGGDLKVGDKMQVDNGVLHMRVTAIDAERVTCSVITPGQMGSRRHINLPGIRVSLPPLTDKDHADLAMAVRVQADFVAMSFVRDAAHVALLKGLLKEQGSLARVVAKIEDQQAVANLEGIIEAADAVMVARGDLGIEVQLEELPIVQRRIIKKCVHMGRKVIVATHMLESMTENPVPTRAEVTDVANAAYEEADAVMLSGETSVGKYPVRCVEVLDKVCRRTELSGGVGYAEHSPLKTEKHKIVKSAVVLANSMPDAKIVVFTKHGVMAHYTAHLRPKYAPIFAFCPALDVCRSLIMSRAVHPMQLDFETEKPEPAIDAAVRLLKAKNYIHDGDPLILISDVLYGEFKWDSIILKRA
ncbi:MAG: pyruvate kinase [Verrucomicrobiae bacterium]|nr:pyruvate kinase [Verrucomicrobiae bacterium]